MIPWMYSYDPSFWQVLNVHLRKIIRWHRNSSPYLSIDSFAALCEINVTPPRFRGLKPSRHKIRRAKSIFCDSDKLQAFLDEHHHEINARVIISGNTDFEFNEKLRNLPSSIKRIYLQNNSIINDSLYRSIPIGIENFRLGVNGNPKFMKKLWSFQDRYEKILLGPFSPTHQDRSSILNSIQSNDFIDVFTERIEPRELAKLFQKYKFVAAVRGNGVDTHRLWEALYRGCIPIVQESDWSSFLFLHDLPVIPIKHWTTIELVNCLRNNAVREYDPKKIESLWMGYWKKLITQDLVA